MNVYKGNNRRQVGGGLFSTISRGARPLILSLIAKIKPHLLSATKAVGKRAAKAALNVGTDLATNLATGRLNKRKAKDIIHSELDSLKTDALDSVDEYKRKFEQSGSGKRRKLNKPKMAKKKVINKGRKPKRLNAKKKVGKRNKKQYKRKQTKRRKTKRVFNNDIFGK